MHSENHTMNPSGIKTVLLLIVLLLLLTPPYLIHGGHPSPVRSMESICMQTSLETWQRVCASEPMAWWNPSWDGGVIRIEKPPLLVWLNLLAWHGLTPTTATMEQLAFGARLMTTLVVLIGIASVFWIGLRLRNAYTAVLAALCTGTFFLLIKQTHYATYDAQLMGWATLAVALGIRAITAPEKGSPTARLAFWGLAGLATGATLMTKGPVGAVWVLAPLATAVILRSKRPAMDVIGLLFAALIGAAILSPWYLHTVKLQAAAISTLADEYRPVDTDQFRPVYYYAGLIALVFPWTFWWIASWFRPFREKNQPRARFFPLLWFLLPFLFLCAWPMRNARYLVPLLPSIGLMCAVYLDQVITGEAAQLLPQRLLRLFWGIALVVSVLFAPLILLQGFLVNHGLLEEMQVEGMNRAFAVTASGVLLLITVAGWRTSVLPLRQMAFIGPGLWMIALNTFAYYGYSLAEHQNYPWRAQAESMASRTADRPVFYLYETDRENPAKPEMGFTLYALKILRAVTPDELETFRQADDERFLLVPEDSTRIPANDPAWESLGTFQDDDHRWNLLRPVKNPDHNGASLDPK